MKHRYPAVCSLALTIFAASYSPAATSWTGAVDQEISKAGNWSAGLPTLTNAGTIGSATVRYSGNADLAGMKLTLNTGAVLRNNSGLNTLMSNGGIIILNNNALWDGVSKNIVLGNSGAASTVRINQTAQINAATFRLGSVVNDAVYQSGGTVTVSSVWFGATGSSSFGTYNLSGGKLVTGDVNLAPGKGTINFTTGCTAALTVSTAGTNFNAAGGFSGLVASGSITINGQVVTMARFSINNAVAGKTTLTLRPRTHLLLLSGQSNMSRMIWSDETNHTGYLLGQVFEPALRGAFPNDEIIVASVAEGGRTISHWVPYASLYNQLINTANTLTAGKTIDTITFIWRQGEADHDNNALANAYESNLRALYDQLKADYNTTKINWVIGRLNDADIRMDPNYQFHDNWIHIRQVEVSVANSIARATWVDCDTFNDDGGNGVHGAPSDYLRQQGAFAVAAIDLIDTFDP